MNWQHFQAFLWLRWRLFLNQLRRGGTTNAVIQGILAVGVVVFAIGMAVIFFLVGLSAFRTDSSVTKDAAVYLLYVWDGVTVAFLFCWMLGLLIELQRSEVLSLDKFLHLPVSLKSAFLINYVGSLFSVTMIAFAPSMITFSLGLAISQGPPMLLQLPSLAAFLLMVTALTYQFQGWLASLMANKRRRRTVIVVVTALFILLCQLPNLVNLLHPWQRQQQTTAERKNEELKELQELMHKKTITPSEYMQRSKEIENEDKERVRKTEDQSFQKMAETARLLNLCLPPGWLPLGAEAAAGGEIWPALLGTLGMTSIGAFSLWRSYRTTMRLYTGAFTSGKRRPVAVAVAAPAKVGKPSGGLLEWQLPWVSEPVSAIALSGFRSLMRAPEVKMIVLTPIIMLVVFGSIFYVQSVKPPDMLRPLPAFGAMSMILVSLTQLVGNQFGFDRSGFRTFVLSAVPRRDILVGKNLAVAPLALGLSAILIGALQVMFPMRAEHLLATVPQLIAMYLLFCMLANCMSIFTPMPVRSGTLKPANPKGTVLLLQVALLFFFPLTWAPMLLPLGVELALEHLGGIHGVPICLLLCLVECAGVIFLYRLVVTWQGDWLQLREQKILETVTSKTE